MENNNLDLDFDKISSQILGELDEAQKAGKNVPESVWAPGIPSNIKEEDKVKKDELLSMAVDYLMIKVCPRWIQMPFFVGLPLSFLPLRSYHSP